MSPKAAWFWPVLLIGLVLDQVTKFWVYLNLEYRVDAITVIPGFFEIVHAQNPGAAFGMLTGFEYRYLVFLGFTVVAGIVIVDMYRRLARDERMMGAALGLILSGAVGNAIDRVHKRTVTDFARFFTEDPGAVEWMRSVPFLDQLCGRAVCEWPSFNVADAALLIGVGLFFVHATMYGDEDPADEAMDIDDEVDALAHGGALDDTPPTPPHGGGHSQAVTLQSEAEPTLEAPTPPVSAADGAGDGDAAPADAPERER